MVHGGRFPILAWAHLNSCNEGSLDVIIETIEKNIIPILQLDKVPNMKLNEPTISDSIYSECDRLSDSIYSECDRLFNLYFEKLNNPICFEDEIKRAFQDYQISRNKLNGTLFNFHENNYRNIIESGDVKKLWSKINWSGRNTASNHTIPIQMMSNYFEQLYQPLDINEKAEMESLESNIYIPITDDPITETEITNAYSDMKKGGYDFSLHVLNFIKINSLTLRKKTFEAKVLPKYTVF